MAAIDAISFQHKTVDLYKVYRSTVLLWIIRQ